MRTSAEALKILTDVINSPKGTNADCVCVFAQRFLYCYNGEHKDDCTFEYNGHVTNVWADKGGHPGGCYVKQWWGKHETGYHFDGRNFAEAVTDYAGLCDYFDHPEEWIEHGDNND